MKKICIFFLFSIIISVTALGFSGVFTPKTSASTAEYLRIHIRADDNSESAQAVKYAVRDSVVHYLTPVVATCQTADEARANVECRLPQIVKEAEKMLQKNGYDYGATASVRKERFPTRVYDGYTLPEGEYTALIIELGSGKGDNWWCVVYPPLCFAAPTGENVVYKSKIAEIIDNWKKK